jgi:hypothetical protein
LSSRSGSTSPSSATSLNDYSSGSSARRRIAPVSVTASQEMANALRSTAVEPAVHIPLMGRVPLVALMKMDRMSSTVLGDKV